MALDSSFTMPSIVPDETLSADDAWTPAIEIKATTQKLDRCRARTVLPDSWIVVITRLLSSGPMLRFCPCWVYNNRGLRLAYGAHDSAGSKKNRGRGLASAGGQTNPLVLSLSKDEPWASWRTRELGACPPTIGRRAA